MKVSQFSQYLSELEETTLRNKITEILAQLFKKSSYEEIDKICYLVLGRLAPLYQSVEFNIAEKMMIKIIAYALGKPEEEILREFKKVGDLGTVIFERSKSKPKKQLTVSQLYDRLLTIARQEGTGSQERKIKLFGHLLGEIDPLSAKYVVRIPVGKLRLGFSDLTILDALSWMKTGDKSLRPAIERAYNVNADIGLVAKTFKKRGLAGLKKIKPKVGIPIKPALASRLNDPGKIIEKLVIPAIEPKYDGLRTQVHLTRKKTVGKKPVSLFGQKEGCVWIFSRRLEDITHMFPDLAQEIEKLPVDSAILDGEAIGFDPKTKKFLPFQETAQRKRKYQIEETVKRVPVKLFLFDLLYLNGRSLLKQPFKKRRLLLEKILKENKSEIINLTPQNQVKEKRGLERYFKKYVSEGLEGILCKKINSPYRAGGRDFTWVKYKRAMRSQLADTIDCLVLGYYRGKGKRSQFGIGAFLAGIWDKKGESFLTIAKIGTGLTDSQWREIRKNVDRIRAGEKPKEYQVPKELAPDIWASPAIVVEIKADEITKSPIHSSSYALRFPRMKRFRAKRPEDVTSLKEIKNLYNIQSSNS